MTEENQKPVKNESGSPTKAKKGQKLSLFEAKALFSEKTRPAQEQRSTRPPREPSPDQVERIKGKINQLEKRIETDSLTDQQEQEILAQIANLEKQLEKKAQK